jgi:hypothetical protein
VAQEQIATLEKQLTSASAAILEAEAVAATLEQVVETMSASGKASVRPRHVAAGSCVSLAAARATLPMRRCMPHR